MKKLQLFALLLSFAAFTLFGCGQDIAEIGVNWDGDNAGTLEIFNGANKDMVLFIGQQPTNSNIMGGVRAGATTKFDVSKLVDDFNIGGYTIIRGISREEYNANGLDLSKSKIEYQAMATYGAGKRYRMTIDLRYTGNYGFKVTNKGRVGMELRKDSPQGEKVAYLPSLQVNQVVYTQSTDAITLFPVYVYYNNITGEVSTLNATSMFESIMATPRSLTDTQFQNYTFPANNALSWQDIVDGLTSPVAYLTVFNDMNNQQGAYVTSGGTLHLRSQNDYDAIGTGEKLVFEIASTNEGAPRQLWIKVFNGEIMIPVYSVDGTTPIIRNSYDYTVTILGSGRDVSGYTATIVETKKRDLSDQLTSL